MPYSHSKPPRRLNSRAGALIHDACVSAAMLAALMYGVNQIVVRLHRQTALVDQHYVAQQALENALEDFTASTWEDLNSVGINEIVLSDSTKAKLPQANLQGEVREEPEPVPAKRITLRLTWQDAAERERPPLTLTTWVYQPAESNP